MFGAPNRSREAGGRRPATVAALVGAAAVALIATLPYGIAGDLAPGEAATFRWFNALPDASGWLLEPPMHLATAVGMALIVVAALVLRRTAVALVAAVAWSATRTVSHGIKLALDRGRPPAFLEDVVLRQHLPASAGYTSTHSACAAALAVVGAWAWPRLAPAFAAFAVLVGVALMFVGVHLPLDVVGGWALGVLVAVPACAIGAAATRRADAESGGATAERGRAPQPLMT